MCLVPGMTCARLPAASFLKLIICMKNINVCLIGLALGGAIGCAAQPLGTLLDPVGPDPQAVAQGSAGGCLQVYSARELAPVNVEMQQYVATTEFSPADNSLPRQFLHASAHVNYSLYDANGKFISRISNAKGLNDAQPTKVKLAPGAYLVEAITEEYDTFRHPVIIPVEIKPGLITVVHLDGAAKSGTPAAPADWVKFPNGEIIGWHVTS